MKSCSAIPGLSDHEGVLANCDIKAQISRKIFQWTNWELIKSEVYWLKQKFLTEYHTRFADENYNESSSRLNTIIDEHAPSKLSRGKHSTPWFSLSLRRLCRKKQRLFTRSNSSHKKAHWDKYKSHKKDTLKAIRRAPLEYVNEILNVSLLKKI